MPNTSVGRWHSAEAVWTRLIAVLHFLEQQPHSAAAETGTGWERGDAASPGGPPAQPHHPPCDKRCCLGHRQRSTVTGDELWPPCCQSSWQNPARWKAWDNSPLSPCSLSCPPKVTASLCSAVRCSCVWPSMDFSAVNRSWYLMLCFVFFCCNGLWGTCHTAN